MCQYKLKFIDYEILEDKHIDSKVLKDAYDSIGTLLCCYINELHHHNIKNPVSSHSTLPNQSNECSECKNSNQPNKTCKCLIVYTKHEIINDIIFPNFGLTLF